MEVPRRALKTEITMSERELRWDMPILFVEHNCKQTVVGEMWGRVRRRGKRRDQRAGMGEGRLPRPFRQWRTLSFSL